MDFRTLNTLFKYGKEFGHKRIKDCGISDTEFMICSYVYYNSGCSQDDVVKALRIDKTTAAKAIQSLENKEYIERGSDEADRRKKTLKISEAGKNRIVGIIDLHDKWMHSVMSALTEDEKKQFELCCKKLLTAAENMLPA